MAGVVGPSDVPASTRATLKGGERYASDITMKPGGGSSPPPQTWLEAQGRLAPQAAAIRREALALTAEQLGRVQRVIVEADTAPNFLAASHYPGRLFDDLGVVPVGSRPSSGTKITATQVLEDQPAKTFLLAADSKALERLDEFFSSTAPPQDEKVEIDARKITELRLAGPQQVLQMGTGEAPPQVDGMLAFEAVLHPQLAAVGTPDPAAEQAVREDFASYVSGLGGRVNQDFVRQEGGMWHLPVLLPPSAVGEAAKFAHLRVLRPMARLRDDLRRGGERWTVTGADIGAAPTDARRIAVFDGGVDLDIPGLAAWVSEYDRTGQDPAPAHRDHGMSVTSAALFGHIEPAVPLPAPICGVDHYRIWPPPPDVRADVELPWVLTQIEDVVSDGRYRIVVISLAPELNSDDAEPHIWTVTLDRLALDQGVLFVVAAGNTGDLAAPLDRLLVPGDLINGLSVGSCTEPDGLAVRDDYSCIGPGRPGGMTAPTGVQFGGNLDDDPFGALICGGEVLEQAGTSLAAPVVARGLADLDGLLGDASSANLLRTLAVHHAERPNPKREGKTEGSRSRDVGYGRFATSYRRLLEHDRSDVTIIYEGKVARRQRIALDIPVPEDVFASEPTKTFQLRWTLGFFAPVEPANPVDYSAAGINVAFRPNSAKYKLYDPDGNDRGVIDIVAEATRWKLSEAKGYELGQAPLSGDKPGVAPEIVQRQALGKWEGVVRMDRGMQGRTLYKPRIDFHMLIREGGDLVREADDLDYVLVVSVAGPPGVDVYDRTKAYATLLTPVIVTVPVTT